MNVIVFEELVEFYCFVSDAIDVELKYVYFFGLVLFRSAAGDIVVIDVGVFLVFWVLWFRD